MPSTPIIPLLNSLAILAMLACIAYAARQVWRLRPRSLPIRRRRPAKRVLPYAMRKHAEVSVLRRRALLHAGKLRAQAQIRAMRHSGHRAPVRLGRRSQA
jgi:hypothetical protein